MWGLKECSSCGALYTKLCACLKGGFADKFIRDPNKTPFSSQRPPHDYPRCGSPVDGLYCRHCALLRNKLKEAWFTICDEHTFSKDFLNTFESSNDNSNVVTMPQEPVVFNQDSGENSSQKPVVFNQDSGENSSQSTPQIDHHCCYGYGNSLDSILCQRCTCKSCGKGAHYGYNCPPKVPIIFSPEACHDQNIEEFPQTLPSSHPTCYSRDENIFTYDSTPNLVKDSPNVFNPPSQPPMYSYEFCGDDLIIVTIVHLKFRLSMIRNLTPVVSTKDYLIIKDGHLNTILGKESDEFIKSSVENLVLNPSESEDERECGVPTCDDFTTFSNLLFDADNDFSSSDDESFSNEDILKEIYSNPLFDKEIIYIKIDPHHLNVESDLIKSLLNQDSLIISSSKIDSLLDEFTGELILLKSIPPGIDEADCDPEKQIRLIEKLLYDNSSPHDSMPSVIEDDNYDSEGNILILEELLSNDSLSLPENESLHFDIPSSPRPPVNPLDDDEIEPNSVKVMGDIS
nr:hypothetical protein [Tanacetum cinerariifolium]